MPCTASTISFMPGLMIVERADIHLAGAALAEIGEPEPAVPVEHQIVRPASRRARRICRTTVRPCRFADRSAGSSRPDNRRAAAARHDRLRVGIQLKPPLLQMYILPSGPRAAPLGPPGISRDYLFPPVGINPRQPLAADFDQHHRAVGHNDRAFRKLQIGGENANIGHESSRLLWLQADFGSIPHAQQFVAPCYGKVDIACQATAGNPAAQSSIAAGWRRRRRMGRA